MIFSRIAEIDEMKKALTETGAKLRADLSFDTLFADLDGRRFNMGTLLDSSDIAKAYTLFTFEEEKPLAEELPSSIKSGDNTVFLSHTSADSESIESLIPFLQELGLPVFYDSLSIEYGESIVDKIQEGTANSLAVIFFITEDFLKSPWCNAEVKNFLSRYSAGGKIKLFSVVSESVNHDDLPIFLQDIKYLKVKYPLDPRKVVAELGRPLAKVFQQQ